MPSARCPQCDSTSTKTFPMVYASGTSTSKSSSFWVTSKGRIGSRSGRGTRQSKLAEATSPPRRPSVVLGFIGMVLVEWILLSIASRLLPSIIRLIPNPRQALLVQKLSPLIILGLGVLIFLIWVVRHRMKKRRFLRNALVWERTWLCQRCGATWIA